MRYENLAARTASEGTSINDTTKVIPLKNLLDPVLTHQLQTQSPALSAYLLADVRAKDAFASVFNAVRMSNKRLTDFSIKSPQDLLTLIEVGKRMEKLPNLSRIVSKEWNAVKVMATTPQDRFVSAIGATIGGQFSARVKEIVQKAQTTVPRAIDPDLAFGLKQPLTQFTVLAIYTLYQDRPLAERKRMILAYLVVAYQESRFRLDLTNKEKPGNTASGQLQFTAATFPSAIQAGRALVSRSTHLLTSLKSPFFTYKGAAGSALAPANQALANVGQIDRLDKLIKQRWIFIPGDGYKYAVSKDNPVAKYLGKALSADLKDVDAGYMALFSLYHANGLGMMALSPERVKYIDRASKDVLLFRQFANTPGLWKKALSATSTTFGKFVLPQEYGIGDPQGLHLSNATRDYNEYIARLIGYHGEIYPRGTAKKASGFGSRKLLVNGRLHSFHYGLDLQGKLGAPVFAVRDGVIDSTYNAPGWGLSCTLASADGQYQFRYAHLSRLFPDKGAVVRRGDIIGLVGRSGLSSVSGHTPTPHLHFEMIPYARVKEGRHQQIDPSQTDDWKWATNSE